MVSDDQEKCVGILHSFAKAHSLVRRRNADAALNGTGDGVLVAFPRTRLFIEPTEVVSLAEELVEHSFMSAPSCRVRVGIHEGPFSLVCTLGRTPQVVGKGPNVCSRVCGVGDGGHIVASEEFLESWEEKCGNALERFQGGGWEDDSGGSEHPIEIFVKHGVSIRIRFLRDSARKGVRTDVPTSLRRLESVDTAIRDTLVRMEAEFVAGLRELDSSLTQELVSARLSIFGALYVKNELLLVPSDYRYHYSKQNTNRGESVYRTKDSGEGSPGIAFVSRKVFVCHRLCDPRQNLNRYARQVESRMNVKTSTVKRVWSRRSRAFCGMPFGLAPDTPDGVLCVDMSDPLEGIHKRDLVRLVQQLQTSHGRVLSALWRLRIHL